MSDNRKKCVKILKHFEAMGLSESQIIALFSELLWNFQNYFLRQDTYWMKIYENFSKYYEKEEKFDMADLDFIYHSLYKV